MGLTEFMSRYGPMASARSAATIWGAIDRDGLVLPQHSPHPQLLIRDRLEFDDLENVVLRNQQSELDRPLHLSECQDDEWILCERVLPGELAKDVLSFRPRHEHSSLPHGRLSFAGIAEQRMSAGGPTLANRANRIEKAIRYSLFA